jgi:hypothetical protein
MTAVMQAWFYRLPRRQQRPLPPSLITSRITRRIKGLRRVDEPKHVALTMLSHFGYGAATGAIYGSVSRSLPGPAPVRGALFGLGVWAVSYLGLLPALRVMPPATRHPAPRNALMIGAHVVWGAVMGLLMETAESSARETGQPAGLGVYNTRRAPLTAPPGSGEPALPMPDTRLHASARPADTSAARPPVRENVPSQEAIVENPQTHSRSLVVGLFRYYENAAEAVDLLTTAGYQPDQVTAIIPADRKQRRNPARTGEPYAGFVAPPVALGDVGAAGAGSGSVAGGLHNTLTGAAPIALPGLGQVFFVGGLQRRRADRTAAAGTRVESDDENLVELLVEHGIPLELANTYAEGVKRGWFLIACETDDTSEVRHFMNQVNVADVLALGEEWRREGWETFDPGSHPGEDYRHS